MEEDAALVMAGGAEGDPGTHVLIIGIGTYDYLLGGDLANAELAGGMRQIPAAVNSARLAAKWFLDEFDHPTRPLASLALVLSEKTPATFDHPRCLQPPRELPNGELDTVATAIVRWIERASSNRSNLALLYFVGHGLHAGSSMLLCRDYGKVKAQRFEWAVNLDDLMVALASRQVDDQLVMIDACRNADAVDKTLSKGGRAGRSILTPDPPEDRDGTEAGQSLHFATSRYTAAWGDEDGVSLFSEALLQALAGGGAQIQHRWNVATGGLQEALTTYVRRMAAEAGVEQVPERQRFADFVVCKPRQLMVPVHVTCSPASLWGSHMSLTVQGPGEPNSHPHDPANYRREWAFRLPKESYTFTVNFEGDEAYDGTSARETIVPPLAPVHIELRRREEG